MKLKYLPSLMVDHYVLLMQVMTSRPRCDLYVNLPALRKLDNMLLVRSKHLFMRDHVLF